MYSKAIVYFMAIASKLFYFTNSITNSFPPPPTGYFYIVSEKKFRWVRFFKAVWETGRIF